MENDLDMDELKELVKRQAALNADTNRVVHSLRRGQRIHTLMSFVWWALVIGVSAYSYMTYVQPYVSQIIAGYDSIQGFQNQARSLFGQYFGTSTRP